MKSSIYCDGRATAQDCSFVQKVSRGTGCYVKRPDRRFNSCPGFMLLLSMFIIGLITFPNIAYGDGNPAETEQLTLDEALEIALVNNKTIDNAVLEVEKAENAIKAARTKLFPEFDFSLYELHHLTDEAFTFKKGAFGDYPVIGPIPAETTKIQTTPNFTTFMTATVGQPISQLYEISLYVKQTKVEKALSGEELRASRQEVADRVKKEYYDILKIQSGLEALAEEIVFLKELYILVKKNVELERVLETELLDVEALLAKAEYKELVLKNDMATLKERFNFTLGRDIETPFLVTPVPKAEPIIISPEEAEQLALDQRPEVRAARLGIEYAENEVKIEKSKYIPEVGVELQYTANFNIQLLPENIATIALFAKWDVFDWGYKSNLVGKKKKSVIQAQNRLDETESDVLIDVNQKIRALEASAMYIGVAEADQTAARENLRVTMNKYEQGTVLLQQVLEAESEMEDANSEYNQAVLDYWTSRAELEKAIGEE